MLLIKCRNIKKYFGDRMILDFDGLEIYSEDRIGVVGRNGSGKTTLINILSQKWKPDEGVVKSYGKITYISQLESPCRKNVSSEIASKLGIQTTWDKYMSGGEKTRFKIAQALEDKSEIIFADEPTSNLDMEGIEFIKSKLSEYDGSLVIISHDRSFLDALCNRIIEVESGKISIYKGNYSQYKEQKIRENERAKSEYEEYIKEKKRLEEVVYKTKDKAKSIKKAPKRMGNSEARLHKMGGQKAKANLEKAIRNVEKRINHLNVKEKPRAQSGIKLDILESGKLYCRIILEGKNINKAFGDKIIFKNASFNIYNGTKTALIGPNGCGKSTLIKMIMDKDVSIRTAQGVKIGYFSQDLDILKKENTIIDNVMESSIYPEHFARLLLARLLLRGETVYKKVGVLSGGEQVKVSFAKILLQDINMLILDEPTNYMDISSLEVIEDSLKEYNRTLLFVSHDRRFIDAVANQIMVIETQKIKMFAGNYSDYIKRSSDVKDFSEEDMQKNKIILQNKLSEIIGRLSMPSKKDDVEALDREYHEIIDKLKQTKKL